MQESMLLAALLDCVVTGPPRGDTSASMHSFTCGAWIPPRRRPVRPAFSEFLFMKKGNPDALVQQAR
jgi:hypothetical protein